MVLKLIALSTTTIHLFELFSQGRTHIDLPYRVGLILFLLKIVRRVLDTAYIAQPFLLFPLSYNGLEKGLICIDNTFSVSLPPFPLN